MTRDIASIGVAVLVVAGLMVAFKPGSVAPAVLTSGGGAAANVIRAATGMS